MITLQEGFERKKEGKLDFKGGKKKT